MKTTMYQAMITEFTLGIGSSLASELVKHGGKRYLDNTLMGAKLKKRLGLLNRTTENEFKKLLLETFVDYFSRYPNRQFQVFYDFFSSKEVSIALFNYVFNFQQIDYSLLEGYLRNRMTGDWILFSILERNGLSISRIIKDFIDCYYDFERRSVGIGFAITLREMEQSERRVVERTTAVVKEASDRIIESVAFGLSNLIGNLESELNQRGIGREDVPTLGILDRNATSVENALHQLSLLIQAVMANAENALIGIRNISGIPTEVNDDIKDTISLTEILNHSILNLVSFEKIANYGFEIQSIGCILRKLVEIYKPYTRVKGLEIEVILKSGDQELELSGFIELALSNIINNAIRFSFYRKPDKQNHIMIVGERIDSSYQLIVRNFGLGIRQDEMLRIFEDGYQGESAKDDRKSGIGRGLYVSKKIILSHNGTIRVSSEELDDGYLTTFEILLPYRQPIQ